MSKVLATPETFILDGRKKPMIEPDLAEWVNWMSNLSNAQPFCDVLDSNEVVSTAFLGIKLTTADKLFETAVIGGPHDGKVFKWDTYEEAEKGHEEVVKSCLS